MKLRLVALLTLLAAVPAGAADLLDRAVANLTNREAAFTQQMTPKGFRPGPGESGSVLFGTLPQMRWTYRAPEQKTFVFDGRTSWFYVPAENQVTVNQLSDRDRAALPFLFLSDRKRLTRDYKLTEGRSGANRVVKLKAKSPKVAVGEITMTIGAGDLVRSIAYTDRQGNHTQFTFSGLKPSTTRAEQFRFKAPPGAQVVGE